MTSLTQVPDKTLTLLEHERTAFLAQVDRVPRARRAQRLMPERWSVTEVIEHLSRADSEVRELLAHGDALPRATTPGQLAAAQLTAEKIAAIHNRSARLEAGESIRPTGKLTLEAALAQLESARSALTAAYRAVDQAVLDNAIQVHPLFGPLTLRAFVEVIAHHDARHSQQVAELADGWNAQDRS